MDPYIDLLKVLLPELLITHFDIVKHEIKQDVLHLNFEEKVAIPQEFSSGLVISHGFHKEITIQDFPIRGKKVYLHIKRRRWLDKMIRIVVQKDWNLVAQGTRITVEFAAFLKYLITTKPNDSHTIGSFYGVNGKKFQRQYRESLREAHCPKREHFAE